MDSQQKFQHRANDTFGILPTIDDLEGIGYANGVVDALKEQDLMESVPAGTYTFGGGVLLSVTRLRFELAVAYAAGKESVS